MKIYYDINNNKTLKFKNVAVQQRKDSFFGIYQINNGELLMHKSTWKQATKIAKLLEDAYNNGWNDAKDDSEYFDDMHEEY